MRNSAHNSTVKKSQGTSAHGFISRIEGEAFASAIKRVPQKYLVLSEPELREKAKPTSTDYALRLALWNEIRIAEANDTQVETKRVFANICSYQHFYHNVLNNPAKLAWLLSPLKDYEQSLEPLLVRIAERYDELINLDIYDSKGKPDPAIIKLVLKAMEQVESRLRGEAIQRTESKNLNVTVAVPTEDEAREARRKRLEELSKQAFLQQNGRLPAPGEI